MEDNELSIVERSWASLTPLKVATQSNASEKLTTACTESFIEELGSNQKVQCKFTLGRTGRSGAFYTSISPANASF